MRGRAIRGSQLAFGDYGLIATEPKWITARQLEASRVACNRHTRRQGRLFLRIFPDKPVTAKPAETRMGKGKGAPEYWVAVVRPGRLIYELKGIDEAMAREAFRRAAHKLPVKTKFVSREDLV
jgi:large subunit ribosomal protein L16